MSATWYGCDKSLQAILLKDGTSESYNFRFILLQKAISSKIIQHQEN